MKKFSLALVAAAAALAIAPIASAGTITGTLNIAGSDTVGAGGITFSNPAEITASTGSFSVFGSFVDQVTMANIPSTVTTPFNLVTGASGLALTDGLIYNVTSYSYSDNGVNTNVTGIGQMELNGYTNTTYTFDLTTQDNSGAISSFSLSAVTPEPSSLLLLGTGLLGLAFVAFRKAKSSGVVLGM